MSSILKKTKYTLVAFISYVISTMILVGIAMAIWMKQLPEQNLAPQELARLANSFDVQVLSGLIGLIAVLIISYLLSKKHIKAGFGFITGFTLIITAYSIVGIFMHPEHHIVYNALKLILPVLVCNLTFRLARKNLEACS